MMERTEINLSFSVSPIIPSNLYSFFMNTKRRLPRAVLWLLIVTLHTLWMSMWCIICHMPTIQQQADGICRVECEMRLCITSENGDTLYLPTMQPDTLSADIHLPSDTFVHCTADAIFIDYDGHLLTPVHTFTRQFSSRQSDSIRNALTQWQKHLQRVEGNLRHQTDEMRYYSQTHTIDDDGYSQAMDYFTHVEREYRRTDSLLRRLDTLLTASELQMEVQSHWSVYVPHVMSTDSIRLSVYDALPVDTAHDGWMMLQLKDGRLPKDAHAFLPSFNVFHTSRLDKQLRIYTLSPFRGHPVCADSLCPQVLPVHLHQDLTGVPDGAPIVNALGQLVGVSLNHQMIATEHLEGTFRIMSPKSRVKQIAKHLWHTATSAFSDDHPREIRTVAHPNEWNVTNPWHLGTQFSTLSLHDGQTYYGQILRGQPHGNGAMHYADSAYHIGHWQNGQREGPGTYVQFTSEGITSRYSGEWEADSLPYGERTAPNEHYIGGFDASGLMNGYGVTVGYCGTQYYQGEYQHGMRHGMGMYIDHRSTCMMGAWSKNNFRGERMLNAAHRVYGIDISRYQHEVGRHIYPIIWKNLRIKRLDRTAQRRVKGEESYPVDFIFIKATQGTKIVNRYYKEDVAAARRHHIPVGAYHFFSPTGGKEQADHFLQNTTFVPGDLPPVLDLELSDAQIKKMGGAESMFAEVSIWIDIVRRHTGLRPILYISQDYTNRYMPDAPPELRECDVWIARYSQYKPYVHTLIWQLSPWGKVEGIHGDVDINVWNGSRPQFQEYIRSLK